MELILPLLGSTQANLPRKIFAAWLLCRLAPLMGAGVWIGFPDPMDTRVYLAEATGRGRSHPTLLATSATARFSVFRESRSAHALCTQWVPRCIWSRPQAESVVAQICWQQAQRPGFLSLTRAEAPMFFLDPMGTQVYLVEAAGRERSQAPSCAAAWDLRRARRAGCVCA